MPDLPDSIPYLNLFVCVLLPVALLALRKLRARGSPRTGAGADRVGMRNAVASGLWYLVAFNLAFFLQELFLTWPKSLTPGLTATLFHNNHRWTGEHPLAMLFQGTGVLALLVTAVVAGFALHRARERRVDFQLGLWWLAYSTVFMALPQFVSAAVHGQTDLSLAFRYLGVPQYAVLAFALVAIAACPVAGWWLGSQAARIDAMLGHSRTAARLPGLLLWPALVAMPLLVLYRIPRETAEVVGLPLAVTLSGIFWVCVFGQRADVAASDVRGHLDWRLPAVLAVAILALFHGVLRQGITF